MPRIAAQCVKTDVALRAAGLVTEVPEKFRVYILEYMAHLSLKDWRAIGNDFVKLQFVTEDSVHPNDVPGLMDSVGVILDLLMLGGGMSSLDNVQARCAPCMATCLSCCACQLCQQSALLVRRHSKFARQLPADGTHSCSVSCHRSGSSKQA